MSLSSSRAESPWAIGITVFAAAMLLMAGGAQFFLLIAIDVLVIWALATTGQAAAARS
jgi:nicotinamide riboside transporter PnuC